VTIVPETKSFCEFKFSQMLLFIQIPIVDVLISYCFVQVAFNALRFAPPVLELGNKLAERMRSKGPYLALHLRMELDVWVRTGCQPGLSHEYDEIINNERKQRPELLTARSNMTYHERKLAGLCPLNAMEVAR